MTVFSDFQLVPLPVAFFERPTLTVARDLLGCYLCARLGEDLISLRVVETEAYTQDDPACHAYGKTTGRAANLYKSPGTAYVYLIYGMYHCLNVVTEPEGFAGAVLFRALEPMSRHETILKTHGPGRLCKALGITGEHNGLMLTEATSPLYLTPGGPVADSEVIQTTRIGITKGVDLPWRFYLKDNPWVSAR